MNCVLPGIPSLAARFACVVALLLLLAGCSPPPTPTKSGFLSSYERLDVVSDTRLRYVDPALASYSSFLVDAVQVRTQRSDLKSDDRAEVASYFHDALVKELATRGFRIADRPGKGTARVRIALTDVRDATWWMKLHPGSSLAGAGRAGAAMEAEIIDSATGDQLAALVQSGVGSQFTLGNFSTVSDVKNIIDQWVKTAGERLSELRSSRSR